VFIVTAEDPQIETSCIVGFIWYVQSTQLTFTANISGFLCISSLVSLAVSACDCDPRYVQATSQSWERMLLLWDWSAYLGFKTADTQSRDSANFVQSICT